MGLNKRNANVTYVRLKAGKFYLKDDDTAYDELEGIITDIKYKKEEYNGTESEKLYVSIESDGTTYIVGMHSDSSYARSLLSFLGNADLTRRLNIKPDLRTEVKDNKEYQKYTMFVNQDGKYLKSYFTKEHPNGMPTLKKVTLNGKTAWDKTDVMEFLKNFVNTKLLPKIKENAVEEQEVETENDDLPF